MLKRRKVFIISGLLLTASLVWGGYQFLSILNVGESSQPKRADVIIILGAAVWPNGPSPALQARVEYAWQLYRDGYAPRLILSGGEGTYPPAEAEAMADLLTAYGAGKEILFLERRSKNTIENIAYSKEIMDQYGWKSALIVTDTFHIKRAMLIAKDQGIVPYGAPVKESVLNRNQGLKLKYTLREVLAITSYTISRILP